MFATAASVLSFVSSFWCRNVDFKPSVDGFPTLSFGVFSYQTVEFSSINGELIALNTCSKYPDYVSMDPYWKLVYAMSIMAPIIGTCTCCGLERDKSNFKVAAIRLMTLVALFQGFTMFLLRSDLCDAVPITSNSLTYGDIYPNSCEMGVGMKLSIAATVLWFLAGLSVICGSGSEEDSLGGRSGGDGDGPGGGSGTRTSTISQPSGGAGNHETLGSTS